MSTTAAVPASNPVTLRDVATAAGVAYPTACAAMGNGRVSQATREKVRNTAVTLGYNKHAVKVENCHRATVARMAKIQPANPVFASRSAETAAMNKMRSKGNSNAEVAHRCGVCVATVRKRIGDQPAEITAANKKFAGKVRSTKTKIKKAYVAQQTVAQYNELAARLNAMQQEAAKASKMTGTPLLRLLPPTKVN